MSKSTRTGATVHAAEQRAAEAHRAAFLVETAILTDPDGVDLDALVTDAITGTTITATELCVTLAWHAVSALTLAAGNDTARALELIQSSALDNEKGAQND